MRYLLIALSLVFTAPVLAQRGGNAPLAEEYYKQEEYGQAAELFQKLFEQTNNKAYYQRLISCYLKLKESAKAEKLVKKQIKKYPDNLSFHIDLGLVYKSSGQLKDMQKQFELVVSGIDQRNLYLLDDISDGFQQAGETDYAIAAYKKARKTLGDPIAYFQEICLLYQQKEDKNALFDEVLDVLAGEPQYLTAVQEQVADWVQEKEGATLLRQKLVDRVNNDAQNRAYPELLIWLYVQEQAFDKALVQAIALDKRFKESGNRLMDLAALAVSNQQYESAIKTYDYVIQKGKEYPPYLDAQIARLSTQYQQIINQGATDAYVQQVADAYVAHLNEWGKDRNTATLMRELASLYAFYLHQLVKAESILEEVIAFPGMNSRLLAQCKLDLGDIYVANAEPWDAVLIYGQVEKSFKDDPLGQEAKFRNARLSYYQGDFDWAKAQLDVLKGSTSQLFANDALNLGLLIADNTGLDSTTDALKLYAKADLLIFQNRFAEANTRLDSITALYPNHSLADELLMARARIAEKNKNYDQALNYYQEVIGKFPQDTWADDALFSSGKLYQLQLKNTEKAMEAYQKILSDYPGSLYVVEARKRFRNLRGDKQP